MKKIDRTTLSPSLCLVFALVSFSVPLFAGEREPLRLPGVVLSFDDYPHAEHWARRIPLFARYDARATFFVNAPDKLDKGKKEALRKLAEAGHEIGCHGFRHLKATDAIRDRGPERYLEVEIEPANDVLRTLGFEPVSFAYPMSANNPETDKVLSGVFRHIRTGSGIPEGKTLAEVDTFFVPVEKTADFPVLTGRGIDRLDDDTLERHVYPALQRALERKEIVVFYAHNIAEASSGHHIRPEMLEKVLKRIKESGLKCYTFRDLP